MTNALARLLLRGPSADPDAVAICTPDGTEWTYRQLVERSAQHAHALMQQGVAPGGRVAVQCEKSADLLALHLGCIRLGAVYVPLNPAYTATELQVILNDATPDLFISDGQHHGALADISPREFTDIDRSPDDIAAILYTSGTTGTPKGVVLSQENLRWSTQTLRDAWALTSSDTVLHMLPLFHTHGLFVAAYCALAAGASIQLLNRFDTHHVLAQLPNVTVVMGVPTHYVRLLTQPELSPDTCRHIRLFTCGSAPLLATTHEAFFRRTHHRIVERYGMTETCILTSNPIDGPIKPGTVGQPLPGVNLRVSQGESGEIEVQGPNVFKGYWQRPDLHEGTFTTDDWFRTGDLGVIDEDGYVEIIGRAKDLIISGGLNVYPKEVESVLNSIIGVDDSAVIGLPDADLGEMVTAVVVCSDPELGTEDVKTAARQALAGYKTPRRILFVDELPRNALGKVQKHLLRERFG